MRVFVRNANLPICCKSVIYGEKYADILEIPLKFLGIDSIFVPENPDVDPRLSGHADLSVLHVGGEGIFLAPYLKGSIFTEKLEALGASLRFPVQPQRADYPFDALMNVCVFGDYAILNRKTAANELVDYLTIEKKKQLILCKQGYSRCSVCPIGREALITADRGIAVAAESAGISVLLISEGFIALDGFPHGFIGGASFMISDHEIAFTGRLDRHPDRNRILTFLTERHLSPVFLTEQDAFDIGSAVPIFEDYTRLPLKEDKVCFS